MAITYLAVADIKRGGVGWAWPSNSGAPGDLVGSIWQAILKDRLQAR